MLFGDCLHLAAVQAQTHSSIESSCQGKSKKENKKLPAVISGCSERSKILEHLLNSSNVTVPCVLTVPCVPVREDNGKYFPRNIRAEITNL